MRYEFLMRVDFQRDEKSKWAESKVEFVPWDFTIRGNDSKFARRMVIRQFGNILVAIAMR